MTEAIPQISGDWIFNMMMERRGERRKKKSSPQNHGHKVQLHRIHIAIILQSTLLLFFKPYS